MGRLCYPPPVTFAGIWGVRCPQKNYAAGMARVFAVQVQIARCIRVSRYKFYCGQVTSHVTLSFQGSNGAVGLHPY